MKKILCLIALFTTLLGCSNQPQPTPQVKKGPIYYWGGFDGIFIGTLQQLKGIGYPFSAPGEYKMPLMLVIANNTVSIFNKGKNGKLEKTPFENIRMETHKTNAVIFAHQSASPKYNQEDTGAWVETWTFTITRKDDKGLYVYVVRAVNNFRHKPEKVIEQESPRFFFSWSGELKQVGSIEEANN